MQNLDVQENDACNTETRLIYKEAQKITRTNSAMTPFQSIYLYISQVTSMSCPVLTHL